MPSCLLTSSRLRNTINSMKIVVRAPNWVGDAVLSLPAMNAIKKNFPESEIWVAAEEWVKDLFTMDDTFSGTIPLSKHAGFTTVFLSIVT